MPEHYLNFSYVVEWQLENPEKKLVNYFIRTEDNKENPSKKEE